MLSAVLLSVAMLNVMAPVFLQNEMNRTKKMGSVLPPLANTTKLFTVVEFFTVVINFLQQ